MPGTILIDDLRDSIQDQLHQHVQSLLGQAQQVVQPVQAAAGLAQAPPQIQLPVADQVQSALLQHVDNLTQGAQQNALQVLGQGQQAAGGALTELGAQRDQVQSALLNHVNTLTGGAQSGLQSLATAVQPTIQTLGGGQPSISGGETVAPDHEPSPPLQTPGTQIANTPDDTGRVFPLAVKPDNAPSATYHSQGGSDLMAPRGTPVLNMQRGTVEEVFTDNGSHTVGGNAVLVHGDDGLDYYYAHFDQPSAVKVGQRVDAGEQIGAVGNSGNAWKGGEGATHLHIGIGHGISNGVGSEGGLGQNFNAQALLTNLQSGIGQAAGAARDTAQQFASDVQTRVGQGQKAFVSTLQPLAQQVAQRTGIDPNAMLAIAANETGWGQSQNAQRQNNLFSIQGDGSNGSRWASYKSPAESFNAFVNLISSAPRYAQAWADRADPAKFVDDLRSAGYVADEPGFPAQGWVDQVKSIYRNLPVVGTAQADTAGASAQRQAAVANEPINLGTRPQARPPLVMGGLQDASGNEVADQGPTPIQTAQDVLGGAAQAISSRVGQVASDLGSAAQGVLGAAQDINRIQPGTEAVRAVQGAAEAAGSTAQDINRLQPGTAAVQAATPVLGGVASDIGAGARGAVTDLGGAVSSAYGLNRTPQERQAANEQYQRDVQAAAEAMNRRSNEPISVGDVASNAWNQIIGANPPMGISLQQYQDAQNVKNQWLEQNNPARDVLVLGGLTTSIAQQLTDPLMIATFGPSMGLGRAAGAATAERVGGVLTGRLAPRAVEFASTVADKLASGAIVGGVQNALLEAEKPDATPESVFTALWQGAGFGAAADIGSAAAAPVVRRIGQTLIDRAAELRPRVAEFVGSEVGTVGRPADVAAERARQVAREPTAAEPAPAPEPTTRMYHGTGAEFPSPEPGRFAEEGLFGPGYYLTDRPEVAGGVVRGAEVLRTATQQTLIDRGLLQPENALNREGAVLRPGYAQERAVQEGLAPEQRADLQRRVAVAQQTLANNPAPELRAYVERDMAQAQAKLDTEMRGAGANVRAVDVPRNLKLLNVDALLTAADRQAIADALRTSPRDAPVARLFDERTVGATDATGKTAYDTLANVNPRFATDTLTRAGFDGITYEGGQRIPMTDATGAPIQHQATVIFPDSLPKIRNAISGRQGGQAILPLHLNVGGAVAGGVAGNVATPENASPEERLRNIALGAGAGLAAGRLVPRALEGGFRAPRLGDVAELARSERGEVPIVPGEQLPPERPRGEAGPERVAPTEKSAQLSNGVARVGDDVVLGGKAGGIGGSTFAKVADMTPDGSGLMVTLDDGSMTVVRSTDVRLLDPKASAAREAAGAAPLGRELPGTPPQSLSEVHTNPHLLREAAPGETPMTDEQLAAHYDQLDQRYQQNQDRLASIDEQLRNPNAKPERPPWAAGWTNDELAQVASTHGTSPYEPVWWEKVGLNTGSDEVKRLAEGGFRTPNGGREPTPTELRAERNTLAAEQRDIQAAAEQLGGAAPGQRFVARTQTPADLPFAGGEEHAPHGPYATEQASSGPGSLAEDIVTQNGRKSYADPLTGDGLREAPGEVVGTKGGVTGRGISDVEAARVGEPSTETAARMPNLDAMLKGDMPEVRAQIQRAAEDNPELFDAYRQGRISHDSLVTDLATKVGMTREQWLKTPVGKGFSTEEMVALQAAAIDAQARSEQMAKDIAARGGVDALSPEQVAYGLNELVNNTRLLAVARGGRTTAGRTLNALKIRLDATLARGITASNDRVAATRLASQARAAVKRASQQLEQAKQLDAEKRTVVTQARASGTPKNILDQIAEAYDQLDRYQAMSLHEKADDYNALKAAREAAAAKRQAAVREPPQELLSALQAELKAERDNFAKRKDTWETMAFWDSKANENVVAKRNAFRGGLYIEQYRKAADLAAKSAEADAKRAFNLESRRQTLQTQRATTLLESVGGAKPSRELLAAYVEAVNSNDPLAAGKFVKGLMTPGWWARAQTLRIAGLLSSTITHMANMVGNVTQVPLEVATHAAVVPIDWARARATGGRRVAYMAELGPMLEAYGPGFLAEMPDALKILQTGITPADAVKLENIRPGIASGSGAVDAALEGPLRALQAEDQLFRGGAFAMQAARVATRYAYREGFRGEQLAGRRANIIKNLEDYPDLYKEAHDAMLRMVFQEHRDWIPAPRGAARGVISQVLPFIKTPANITAQGMGLSPFGVAGSIEAVRARGALEATGKASTAQLDRATLLAEQRIARTAIGTAILGLGVGLGAGTFTAGKSMLTGAYDPNEASTYPQGWREWSMVAEDPVSGNTDYIPMQNFGAAGAPLAMAAILTDAAKRGHSLLDKDETARAATSIGQYVLDNTFLQGLSDTVNVLHDPSRYANKFLESLVSSYGPFSAMGHQIQRAYGVASRNPHDGLMGLVEAMEANYPGLSGNVPEALTAIGEPRTQGISGAAAFALPLRADILRDEPTLQALRANDVRIPPPAKAVNVGRGWAIDLTPEEQDQVQRARGEQLRQQVAAVMDSALYKNGDISVRNQLLQKAVSAASQNSDVLFVRSLSDADIKQRAVRKTEPTPYTVAGEPAA